MRTSELGGAALDWAVAKCEGKTKIYQFRNGGRRVIDTGHVDYAKAYRKNHACYSTDWAQGGAIIEREKISLVWTPKSGHWTAVHTKLTTEGWEDKKQDGETPLIAAMRCYVASKLGDEIEIPEELT